MLPGTSSMWAADINCLSFGPCLDAIRNNSINGPVATTDYIARTRYTESDIQSLALKKDAL